MRILKTLKFTIELLFFLFLGIGVFTLLNEDRPNIAKPPSVESLPNWVEEDRSKTNAKTSLARLKYELEEAKVQKKDKKVVLAMEELIKSMEYYISSPDLINPPKSQ